MTARRKKGQQNRKEEFTIERLDEEGIGLCEQGGKTVRVVGALPGEKILAEIEYEGRHTIGARMVKRLTNARERSRRQNCSKAEQCQGCPLISMDYAAQLHFKHEKVARALAAYPELTEIKVNTVLEAPRQLGYRSSAKLAIGKERGKVKIGLYRRNTHQVIDIGDCPLHHPLINEVVAVVREEIERQGVFVYRPDKDHGLLRYLVVRVSPQRNEAMVTFVTRERCDREVIHLAKWLVKKVPTVVSVHQNINTGSGNAIWGNQTLRMMGHPSLLDQVGDLKLRIGPNAFFQVNHDQAERIYQLAREWAGLSKEEEAVDLYCGIGGIALNLARDARMVIGVEVVQEAVRNAADNARLNEFGNCRFLAGDAAQILEDLALTSRPAVVTVNPPRKGCDPEALRAVASLAPRTLIYVSCNPETLARDLALLAEQGYRCDEIQPVDMFPQTPHVESVARLEHSPKK
ncbi:MAG: 23S rRNA (uracil(1939)-C(5))-methyltransferase RlmD [Geoalkalibacter sp.]|uniref:23S rRNA (uracil(1939)-C(5))-methyltransferase RlmD n=1 Tax=Geoalkalibacter sp. TaxID=3041440 RepID=UPI003D0B1B3E